MQKLPVTRFLLTFALLAALCGATSAQPARFENTMAQRMLACAACHGAQGRAAPDGYYPRIAGKPAGYLYNQLLNFRDGRRHYGLMIRMVDPLTDAYLWEIAQYFSQLDLPYPAPQPTPQSAAVMERGRLLVHSGDPARSVPACTSCHGNALTGVKPATPGLLGLPRDYINAQIGAWKTRERSAHAPDCMAQVANRLATEDVMAISSWLAAQPLPADPHPVPATALAGPLPLPCGTAAPGAAR